MSDPDRLVETAKWTRYAQEDLAAARALTANAAGVPRHVCWLAQQAAEKAIKAVLVYLQIDFPRTHDLDALRALLPDDWKTKTDPADLAELTEWAVEARYPGDWADAVPEDARSALKASSVVCSMVESDFRRRGIMFDG